MKKLLLLATFALFAFVGSDISSKEMVIEAIGQKAFKSLQKKDQDALRMYKWRVEKGYALKYGMSANVKGYTTVSNFKYAPHGQKSVDLSAEEMAKRLKDNKFNILCYDFPFSEEKIHRIRIGETGMGIMILSANSLRK